MLLVGWIHDGWSCTTIVPYPYLNDQKKIYLYVYMCFTPTCLLAKYSIYTYHLPLSWICLRRSFWNVFFTFYHGESSSDRHLGEHVWNFIEAPQSKLWELFGSYVKLIHVPMLLQDYTLYLQISSCFLELICSASWDLGKLETRSRVNEVLGSGDGLFRSVFVECDIPIDIRWERRHTNVLRSMIVFQILVVAPRNWTESTGLNDYV